jgi:hypothetical protein
MQLRFIQIIFIPIFSIILFTGCSNKDDRNKQTIEEKIWQAYSDNGRLKKYNELKEKYGDNKLILLLNEDSDAWWITNFTLWVVFLALPDVPETLAGAGVIGMIYLIAWWLGVVLSGGGILAVLAFVGGMLGGIPGIPAAIMGIVYLGVMSSLLSKLFELFLQ